MTTPISDDGAKILRRISRRRPLIEDAERKRNHLGARERADFLTAHSLGVPTYQIAKAAGVTPQRVRNVLRDAGIEPGA